MRNRAYALVNIKRVSEDERVIEGIASTPTPDRMGDVVEPLGGKFALPLVMLLDHDARQAVGQVEYARATSDGIEFRARIAKIDEPGEAKDLVDRAWQLVKAKLRAAVSIGFRPLPDGIELMRNGGVRFKAWEWLELSLVAIPANAEATIFSAKTMRDAAREIARHDRSPEVVPKRASRVVRLDGKSAGSPKGRVVRLDPPAPGTPGRTSRVVALDGSHRWKGARLTATDRQEIAALKEATSPRITAGDRAEMARFKREFERLGGVSVRITDEQIAAARRRGKP